MTADSSPSWGSSVLDLRALVHDQSHSTWFRSSAGQERDPLLHGVCQMSAIRCAALECDSVNGEVFLPRQIWHCSYSTVHSDRLNTSPALHSLKLALFYASQKESINFIWPLKVYNDVIMLTVLMLGWCTSASRTRMIRNIHTDNKKALKQC